MTDTVTTSGNTVRCPLKHGGSECPFRPLSEADRRCLMHSESPAKDADAFWQSIEQQIQDADFDFSNYVFPAQVSFLGRTFPHVANFSDAVFFKSVLFDGVTFSSGASFLRARFNESVTFYDVEFIQEWTQSDGSSRSRNYTSFSEAHFHSAMFTQTKFSGPVTFSDAIFADQARFEMLQFSATALFTDAVFSGGATFFRVAFLDHVDFQSAKFSGLALFDRVMFLKSAHFVSADLQNAAFRSLDLRHCHFAESRNLGQAEFDHIVGWAWWPPRPFGRLRGVMAHRRNLLLGRANSKRRRLWARLKGRLKGRARMAIADEVAARTERDTDVRRRALASAERTYRALRTSYEAARDHPRVGSFYFAEMEMRRLASSASWLGQTLGSLTAWYGLSSGYGERWPRALGWFIGVWLLWAVFYLGTGLWIKVPGINESGFSQTQLIFVGFGTAPRGANAVCHLTERYAHALLHSFLVATLIGRDVYGQPVNALGQTLQGLESVLGPLLLGLMALAVRRQFHR